MTDDNNPHEALASIKAVRSSVADRMVLPWTYDALYAVGVGGMVASQIMPPPFGVIGIGLCLCLLALYVSLWKRKVGVWVSGVTPRRARWVAISGGLLAGVLMIVSMIIMDRTGIWQIPLALAAVTTVCAFFVNRLWVRVYRRELEQGA